MRFADAIAAHDLADLDALGLRRRLEPLEGAPGPTIRLGGRELINLCSNDYLHLAGSPELAAAAAEAANQGTGAGGSRLITGSLPVHARLEAALAEFEGSEAAVLFNSGYCANLGVLQALLGREDAVFCDALNHASLVDGARLCRAAVHVYPHLELRALDAALASSTARRKLIATDSVFSMDGDLAPLPALCDLAEKHQAMLVVDEAHATGIFGAQGSGLAEQLGCAARIDVRVGTLSKAAGSFGAFAAASRAVCELLMNRARAFVFTTALPPTVCAASLASLAEMQQPARRERLWRNIRLFADGLRALDLPAEPRSPIFPVVVGDSQGALQLGAALRERGVLAKAIRPPTVPAGTSRIRFSVGADHTEAQLRHALESLGAALGRALTP